MIKKNITLIALLVALTSCGKYANNWHQVPLNQEGTAPLDKPPHCHLPAELKNHQAQVDQSY